MYEDKKNKTPFNLTIFVLHVYIFVLHIVMKYACKHLQF